ncbi:MAG: TIGR04084 family radical SAM/SPASM domain-containing protein [archaeon]
MYFHIILTERCNSQCRYCYEKSMNEFDNGLSEKWEYDMGSPIDSNIDVGALKKFLLQDEKPVVIFYGGEPLMQMKKMFEIMDNINVRFCMQTNGKLLNKIPEIYLRKFSKILVSIDGDKERTDFNRGEGTYDVVLKNVGLVRERGFNGEIVARMTISFPDIFEQVKHLSDLNIFDSFHWQLDAGFYKNDFDEKKFEEFVRDYNCSISKLIDYWTEEMKKGNVVRFYPFVGIVESLIKDEPTKLRCGSGYANYTITTSGKISACPIVNNVKEFYCGDLGSNISELKEFFVGEPCVSCGGFKICGGRCLYSNYAKLWSEEGEEMLCKTVKYLIDELKNVLPEIKKLISEGKIKESDFEYEKYFGPEIIP